MSRSSPVRRHEKKLLAMDDLEHWLRATMQSATLEPPRNLLAGVWRRRRTHLRRVGATSAATLAAIAIAVPSFLASTTSGPRTGPAGGPATPGAAPGSELLTCGTYSERGISGGELSANWKAKSIQAGPVWFVYARDAAAPWGSSQRLPDGRLRDVGGAIIAVRNGSTAEITTAQPTRFRFITSDNASGSHTLHDGVAAITLVGCPSYQVQPGIPEADAPGLTLFYLPLGYVTDLTGCLPMQVRTPPSWQVRWTADIPLQGTCRG
ncbi:MAG: hypothetical protein J2P28_11320 [Actinobacteria bacterium]|nr:hypothetical protein [Actinomycetota bacterium]